MSISVSITTRLHIIFAWMTSSLMSLLTTGWIGRVNASTSPDFLACWVHVLVLAQSAVFTTVLIATPLMQQLTQRLVVPSPMQPRKENSPPGGRRAARLTAGKAN